MEAAIVLGVKALYFVTFHIFLKKSFASGEDDGAVGEMKTLLMSEFDVINKGLDALREMPLKTATMNIKSALTSLSHGNEELARHSFLTANHCAMEAIAVTNSFQGKVLATKIRVISTLYLFNYFSADRNLGLIADQLALVFSDFIETSEVKQAIKINFEKRSMSTTIWMRMGGDGPTSVTKEALQELTELQALLQEHTSQTFHVMNSNGEIVHLNYNRLKGHKGIVWVLAISDVYLFSGSEDTTIKVWDLSTHLEVATLSGHSEAVRAMVLADGDRLFSASRDGAIKAWDVGVLSEVGDVCCTFHPISALAHRSPFLVSAAADGVVRVWEDTALSLTTEKRAHKNGVSCIVMSDTRLFTAAKTLKVWSLPSMDLLHKLTPNTHHITAMVVGAENRLYTGSRAVRVWDINTFQELGCLRKHSHAINCIALSGNKLVSAGNVIKLWDLSTMAIVKVLREHVSSVHALAASEAYLYSASDEHDIFVRSLKPSAEAAAVERKRGAFNELLQTLA